MMRSEPVIIVSVERYPEYIMQTVDEFNQTNQHVNIDRIHVNVKPELYMEYVAAKLAYDRVQSTLLNIYRDKKIVYQE